MELGILKKSGAWYTYEGEQLGQGREKAKEFLAESPELMVDITEKILRKSGIGVVEEAGRGRGDGISRSLRSGRPRESHPPPGPPIHRCRRQKSGWTLSRNGGSHVFFP